MPKSGTNIAEDLKNSFGDAIKSTVGAPIDAVNHVVDKAKSMLGMKPTSDSSASSDTSWHDQMVKQANDSFKPKSAAPAPSKPAKTTPPTYHKGTDYVPKTGPAILKKGEAVLNPKDAEKHREAKAMKSTYDVGDELGGKKEEKPKKEIEHIKTKKAKSGGYVHEHHHTHPEHHPMETHVSANQDAMVNHMMEHMGEPNPGEQDADAGQAGMPSAAAAPAAAPAAPAAPAAAPAGM